MYNVSVFALRYASHSPGSGPHLQIPVIVPQLACVYIL
jgi:hypothetical protein